MRSQRRKGGLDARGGDIGERKPVGFASDKPRSSVSNAEASSCPADECADFRRCTQRFFSTARPAGVDRRCTCLPCRGSGALPNGHRLELVANTGTQQQIDELRRVAPDMLEEWSRTKQAPRHAAWLHELEFTGRQGQEPS